MAYTLLDGPVASTSCVHLLPAHFDRDGTAQIATYFLPERDPETVDAEDTGERIATLRGRLIRGTPLRVPEGYEGRIIRVPTLAKVKSKPTVVPSKRPAPVPSTSTAPTVGQLKKRRMSPRKPVQRMAFSLDSDEEEGDGEEELAPGMIIESPHFSSPERSKRTTRSTTASPVKPAAVKTEESTSGFTADLSAIFDEAEAAKPLAETDATTTSRDLTTTARFDSFMLWTVDGMKLDREDDPYAKALDDWLRLSSIIHS